MDAKENMINYYDSSEHRNACQSWKYVKTWMNMCNTMQKFLNGTIDMPGYRNHMGRNKYETSFYQNKLRMLNGRGLLTVDSQPPLHTYTYKTGELVNIKREYIAVGIPIVDLERFVENLLNHPVFVVVIAKKNICPMSFDDKHVSGGFNFNVLNGIDIMCNIYNGTGLIEADIWGKYAADEPKRYNKIPLTLNKSRIKGRNYTAVYAIDPAKSIPLEFILNWNESTIKRKEFILNNIATVYVIDVDWKDKPYNIFEIVEMAIDTMEITDISFD